MHIGRRTTGIIAFAILFIGCTVLTHAGSGWEEVRLPSGKVLLEPPAGKWIGALNAFPINSATTQDGRYLAFLNNGYGHSSSGFRKSIAIFDRMTGTLADFTEPGTGLEFNQPVNICTPFYGIGFSSTGKRLYLSLASTRGDRSQNGIRIHRLLDRGGITPDGFIAIPPDQVPLPAEVKQNFPAPTPSGLAVCPDANHEGEDLLYAALTLSDSVVEMSSKTRKVTRVFSVHQPHHPALPAEYPYALALSPDKRTLFVSLYNGSSVAVIHLADGKVEFIPVGTQIAGQSMPSSHPSHMAVHPSGKWLYVAVENSDLISVIGNEPQDSGYLKVVQNIDLRPEVMKIRNLLGVAPNHLVFTPDGKWLIVSAGLLNAVVLVEIGEDKEQKHRVAGYLPTLWYPHTLEITPDGKELFLTSGKGKGTGTNKPNRPFQPGQNPGTYAPELLQGSLHRLDFKEAVKNLDEYTRAVLRNNQLDQETIQSEMKALSFHPIRHVIYVIKENRTYDQVFGDLEIGKADKTCLYFGEEYTPNQHHLAREFGIYDHFFVSAEVSFNGHAWTTAGINSGWNEQQWQINYSTGNFTYDSEGNNNNVMPLLFHQSDVDTPQSGYIWDSVLSAGKTIGIYGEYCNNPEKEIRWVEKQESLPGFMVHPLIGKINRFGWPIPLYADVDQDGKISGGAIATKNAFKNGFQPLFPAYDLQIPDVIRFRIWQQDFEKIAELQKKTGKDTLPHLSVVRLGNNHTRGVRPGGATPDASVADNDLALGMLVEAISQNPYYWGNTAILVIEDDAQAGCDHVDSHRSPMLFISRYNPGSKRKPRVDSRFLTTASCLRTIEALLGLPAGNLMTATAPLLFETLTAEKNDWHGPYKADLRNLENGLIFQEADGIIRENDILKEMSRITSTLRMEEADQADANALNYVLEKWVETRGRLQCCKK